MNKSFRRLQILTPTTLAALLGLALTGLGSPAGAQQSPTSGPPDPAAAGNPSSQLAQIVVTGSRIASRSYTSDSPLVSVGAAQIAATGQVSLDSALGQLPQFAAAQGQTIVGDVEGSTGFSGGQSYSDLRGLGPERTLVLLDGQRLVPTNPNGSVDLNQIPMALIDSVDVITGGASAVYGSDAMAGVVNFRLRQHFQGIQLSYQHGATTHGDGAENTVSIVMGGNFDHNRGNAVIDLEYNERGEIAGVNRPSFSEQGGDYPVGYAAGNFNAGDLGGNIPISAVNALLAQYPGTTPIPGTGDYGGYVGINHDGTLFTTRNPGSCVQNYRGPLGSNATGPYLGHFISQDCTSVESPQEIGRLLQEPSRRYNLFARVNYAITDNVQAYGQMNFMHTNARDYRSYDGTSEGHPLYVPQNNPYVTGNSALESILSARTGLTPGQGPSTGALVVDTSLIPFGKTFQDFIYNDYQLAMGLKGGVGSTDISWNVFGSYGQTLFNNYQHGYASFPALDAMMFGTANYQGADGSSCVGYAWNPFGDQPMSPGCVEYASSTPENTNTMTQKYVEGDLTGTLWRLPEGDLKFALGVDYRGDTFSYLASPELTPAFNVMPSEYPPEIISGTFDLVGSSSGTQNVREGYVELQAPVLKQKPFAKEVSVDVAGRHSQYDLFGGTNTWKADLRWQADDTFMFRGGFERAIRAPSLQELYSPFVNAGATVSSDPCAYDGSYRAGPSAAQVAALCEAQGVPASALPSFTSPAADVPGVLRGNPTLKPEVADTYSLGFVLTPHFDEAMVRDLGVTVDYFHIKINGAIAGVGAQQILENCFNATGSNPGYSESNFYCQQITRNPSTGYVTLAKQFSDNIGAFLTDGVDVEWHWGVALHELGLPERAGRIRLQSYITYLRSIIVSGVPGVPTLDYSGAIGDTTTAFAMDGSSLSDLSHPRWKANTMLGYAVGPVSAALHWRYIDAQADFINGPGSGPGIPAYSYFDLDATWQATSQIQVTAGATNLADKAPPLVVGYNFVTDAATYDIVGRTYYVGVKANFD
ncbi:MAG TPA: TonB-dependent receptor [Steroidobacteraceae bacterium]|nr:TonB-dependent receptor [Steroidobacteraceae bacterium]